MGGVVCGDNGIASFDRIRYRRHDGDAFLYAFDLIELNGDDMRRVPLEARKATLGACWPRLAPASSSMSRYLAGKLFEELLSISRRCVSVDQAGSSKRDIDEGLGGAVRACASPTRLIAPRSAFGLPISHHLKIHSADQLDPACLGGFHVGHSLFQGARV
jgi:hypothetical protein